MTTASDLKVSRNGGRALPLWESDLRPTWLDDDAATSARTEWLALNDKGAELWKAYRKASEEWVAANPERNYADRAAWSAARDVATREHDDAIKANERKAEKALRAYVAAQRAASVNVDWS